MIRLHTFGIGEMPRAGLLRNLLEGESIKCVIRNESLSHVMGECYPEVWIVNDGDYPRAAEVLDGYLNPANSSKESWLCSRCGETIEGQFSACWKCGTAQTSSTV